MYLEINCTPGISYTVIWESLKAFMRGQIISYAAHEKRARPERLIKLTEQILDVGAELAQNTNPELLKRRLLLQTEFNNLSIKQTELLYRTKQTYYEHGDKTGKLLAHELRKAAASRAIPEI